jgi:hypothetical protein
MSPLTLTLDAKPLHERVKGRPLHSESSSGTRGSGDYPLCIRGRTNNVFPFRFSANMSNTNENPNSFSKGSESTSTAGRSRVFFEKGSGLSSDVFRRQAMTVIGIENEAVGFTGGLKGVA